MNIIDVVKSTLSGGGTTNALSSLVGLNQDQTQRATSAAIPTLLAGLTHVASTPRGAEQLSDVISRQDPGMLDNLPNTLSGQGVHLAEHGQGILSSLMGSVNSSMLGSTLARFTGVGEGAISKLLGVCAPLVLGILGKQQRSTGMGGASGLMNLLSGQKDNIHAAMPTGLGSMLSTIPGFGQSLGTRATAKAGADYIDTARTQTSHAGQAYEPAGAPKSSGMKWAVPLLIAVAVIGTLLFLNRQRHQEPPVGRGGPEQQEVTGAASSFGSDSSTLVNQATTVLSGIQDKDSAEAAVPKLKSINDSLTRLNSTSSQLPESTKSSAKSALQPAMEKYQAAAQHALGIPGAGDTIRPQVDQISSNIKTLTSQ